MVISIIGEPATGKTTLMRSIIKLSKWKKLKYKKLRMLKNINREFFILGIYGDEGVFQGTDLLSMAVQPDALEFIRKYTEKKPETIFLMEGDRLNNQKFYDQLRGIGIQNKIYCLKTDPETKRQRHIIRNDTQSDRFKKSIRTKIENIEKSNNVSILCNTNKGMMHDNIKVILSFCGWKNFTKVK